MAFFDGAGGGLIGAGVGGIFGAISDNARKKAMEREESNPNSPNFRPKRRRLSQIQDALNQFRQQKVASELALADTAFNWANNVRF